MKLTILTAHRRVGDFCPLARRAGVHHVIGHCVSECTEAALAKLGNLDSRSCLHFALDVESTPQRFADKRTSRLEVLCYGPLYLQTRMRLRIAGNGHSALYHRESRNTTRGQCNLQCLWLSIPNPLFSLSQSVSQSVRPFARQPGEQVYRRAQCSVHKCHSKRINPFPP